MLNRRELWWVLVSLNLVAVTVYSQWPEFNSVRVITAPLAAAVSIYGGTGAHIKNISKNNVHLEAIISAIMGGITAAMWWTFTGFF